LAPGSKSDSPRATPGATPWYFRRSSHHARLYSFGVISPAKTFHRHWSMRSPNGRKATLSRAWPAAGRCPSKWAARREGNPSWTRYSGVIESAIVSPIASWNPSLALSRKSGGCVVVGALIVVVAQLVGGRR
jgi:hypothetical protein